MHGAVREVWIRNSCFSSPAFMKLPSVEKKRRNSGKFNSFQTLRALLGCGRVSGWVKGSCPSRQYRGFRLTQR